MVMNETIVSSIASAAVTFVVMLLVVLNGETTVGGATHFRRNNGRPGYVLGDHVFW